MGRVRRSALEWTLAGGDEVNVVSVCGGGNGGDWKRGGGGGGESSRMGAAAGEDRYARARGDGGQAGAEDDDEWDPKTPDISHVGQEYTDSIEGILGFLDDRYAFLDLLWCL